MEAIKKLTNCRIHDTSRQESNEKEWLAARSRGIGGSDIGPILGVSPFTSARQVYFSKTGQYQEALEPNPASKERMYFGHLLEPVVASEYARRTGANLVTISASLVHKDHDWALANIDRLIVDNDGNPIGILECKTTSEYMKDEWNEGEILLTYMYQLQWYLWVLGLEKGAFACLVGGNKFYHYEVFRDDKLLEETIIPAAKAFWFDHVLALKEPEVQATDTDFVNGIYKNAVKNSEIVFEDDVTNDIVETIFTTKAKIKELEYILEEAQNKIKDKLQDTEIGYTKDYVVKWSPRSQKRVDSTVLKTTFPDVYEACLKQIDFRVMTVKGVKLD